MTQPITVGVIGAGSVAQVAHLPVLSRMPEFRIAAVCDNDIDKARSLANRFKANEAYDDLEELLKYRKPDAVVICTPNHLHEIHTEIALSAGTHVLCERPLSINLASIERLEQVRKRSGKVLMVGMNARYRNDVQGLRGFLQGDELGRIKSIRGGWYMSRPSRNALGWRLRRTQSGGGAMLDLGSGVIDLAMWLTEFPNPERVTAVYNWDEDGPDRVEDGGCAMIVCEGGMTIFVDVTWRYVGKMERAWFEVLGSKGSAALNPLRVFKEMHGSPVDVTHGTGAAGENAYIASYRAEWANFAAAIRGDTEAPSLEPQRVLHRVLEALNKSAEEGREIVL